MTLFEIAFMKSLIMAKYRRNIAVFIINLLLTVAGLYVFKNVNFLRSSDLVEILTLLSLLVIAGRLVLFYSPFVDDNLLPWNVKNRELKALQKGVANGFTSLSKEGELSVYFSLGTPRRSPQARTYTKREPTHI